MKKELLINYWKKNYNFNKDLIGAFNEVPREDFVLDKYRYMAYDDIALPVISNQTISQPTTIMIMLDALEIKKNHKILEIGTGTGYTAALLSKLVGNKGSIISLEILPKLAEYAKYKINKLNFNNIKIIKGDGSIGYERESLYDRILVNAASPNINKKLINQLKVNGIMIIPIGNLNVQNMIKVAKFKEVIHTKNLGKFVFVPLKGQFGMK